MEEERIRVLKLGKLKPLSQGDPILNWHNQRKMTLSIARDVTV